jgi:hypothetical protein
VTVKLISCAAFLSLLLAPALACQDGKVKVTLVVILASEDGDKVDPRLKQIAAEIQKENPKFKSFTLKSMTARSLAANEKSSFDLVDSKQAQVLVKHGADKDNKVSLAVTPPDQGEITYQTVCGKFLPIVTRYHTKAKERLILAIRVQPCNP